MYVYNKNLISLQIVWQTYWCVRVEIRLCNCNGVLKIYIIAENIVETCLIEFLWARTGELCAWFLLALKIIS